VWKREEERDEAKKSSGLQLGRSQCLVGSSICLGSRPKRQLVSPGIHNSGTGDCPLYRNQQSETRHSGWGDSRGSSVRRRANSRPTVDSKYRPRFLRPTCQDENLTIRILWPARVDPILDMVAGLFMMWWGRSDTRPIAKSTGETQSSEDVGVSESIVSLILGAALFCVGALGLPSCWCFILPGGTERSLWPSSASSSSLG
jgi:hypothetical protein